MPPVTLASNDTSVSNLPSGPRAAAAPSLLGSLVIAARHRGIHLSTTQLIRDHQLGSGEVSTNQLVRIAQAAGLRAKATTLSWASLVKMGTALPAIVLLRNGSDGAAARRERSTGPAADRRIAGSQCAGSHAVDARRGALHRRLGGEVILLKRDYRLRDENQPFGMSFIAGQLLRDRRLTRDLAICGFILGILALTPILFWRVLVDRVMYYGSLNTFVMLCIAFGVLLVFETIFGYLRRYLVLFVTTRADMKLWSHIFDKLLNLPITYFERHSTGEITHNLNELYKVRNFLQTHLFGTVLDSLVIVIFLPIMFFFSTIMTTCVLGISLLICGWLIAMLPPIRRRVGQVVLAETKRGSFLVEAIHGIRTVTSLSLDARQRHQWDVHIAEVADKRYSEQFLVGRCRPDRWRQDLHWEGPGKELLAGGGAFPTAKPMGRLYAGVPHSVQRERRSRTPVF
jgi:subfamily B ATP-binding cassette protein HlyB/CyaB